MNKLRSKAFAEARILFKNSVAKLNEGIEDAALEAVLESKQETIRELAEKRYANLIEKTNDKFKEKFPKGKVKKTPIIQHSKFEEEAEHQTPTFNALMKKANESDVPLEIIGEVYNRGLDSWNSEMRATAEQYAFARVNSYIKQGKTYFEADSDLRFELTEGKMQPYVSRHYGAGDGHSQTAWKAANKHGKVKYFGLQFKDSAAKHAGEGHVMKEEVESPKLGTGNTPSTPAKREQGTDTIVAAYAKDTPGQHPVKEEVTSAEMKPVIVKAHKDNNGNTVPAKTVMRHVGRHIIDSGNTNDGKNN